MSTAPDFRDPDATMLGIWFWKATEFAALSCKIYNVSEAILYSYFKPPAACCDDYGRCWFHQDANENQ